MEKLVTLRLQHDKEKEHLTKYLTKGWRIKSMAGVGMASDESEESSAFLAIVLENDK